MKQTESSPSIRTLAAAVGVAPSTVSRLLKRELDAPRNTVEAFTEYWLTTREAKEGQANDAELLPRKLLIQRVRKLRADADLAESKAEFFNGGYLKRTDAEKEIEGLATELIGLLRDQFITILPRQYQGRNAAQCKELNASALDTIFESVRTNTAKRLNAAETLAKVETVEAVTKTKTAAKKATRRKTKFTAQATTA